MLRIFEIKLPFDHRDDDLPAAIANALRVPIRDLLSWEIRRQAVDARKKPAVRIIYTVDAEVRDEQRFLKVVDPRIVATPDESYVPVSPGSESLPHRPVIVGSGPAGLFAGLVLARAGYCPLILERGKKVEERCVDVERFWRSGTLDSESNAQFGEGGAGTFSDGKLNSLINDPRCRTVLGELAAAGAPESILISNKPHVGTDRLRAVVRTIGDAITGLGGEVRFRSRVTGVRLHNGFVTGLEINGEEILECTAVVLAIGHSARDTFAMLLEKGLALVPKAFAIGLRIEHPQRLIDEAQFGAAAGHSRLGAADFKLAFHSPTGRSAYTFCMCPGGEVIAAASEQGGVVTNGMSFMARNKPNANAALLVNVAPDDFGGAHPLAGFAFQKKWEAAAYEAGGRCFAAPAQKLGDFLAQRPSTAFGEVLPSYRPGTVPSNLRDCLPDYVGDTIAQAIPAFDRQLNGFGLADAVLTGVETRSSCPVRITRGKDLQANIGGIYPCGEGAGYAGGIMSSAVDGIRVAEAIIARFAIPR